MPPNARNQSYITTSLYTFEYTIHYAPQEVRIYRERLSEAHSLAEPFSICRESFFDLHAFDLFLKKTGDNLSFPVSEDIYVER